MNYRDAWVKHRMSPWRYVRYRLAQRRTDRARGVWMRRPTPANKNAWIMACIHEATIRYARALKRLEDA